MRTYPSSEDVQGATFYYYPGHWIQFQDRTYSAQFHSQGSSPCRAAYRGVTGKYIHNISFTSYPVPIEGQNCQALTWIEPATLCSRVKGSTSLQYTMAWTMSGEVHGETIMHNDVKGWCLHKWILIYVAKEAAMLEHSIMSRENAPYAIAIWCHTSSHTRISTVLVHMLCAYTCIFQSCNKRMLHNYTGAWTESGGALWL